jgi:hypothetical protein
MHEYVDSVWLDLFAKMKHESRPQDTGYVWFLIEMDIFDLFVKVDSQRAPAAWSMYIVVSSAIEEIGAMGREIESRQEPILRFFNLHLQRQRCSRL